MYKLALTPRFCDTDALGHINHAVVLNWFEQAREPVFRLFVPDMNPRHWNLIIARIEVDYKAQIYFGDDIELSTYVQKMGTSSMTIVHEVRQKETLCARGRAVMIHFDYEKKQPLPIPSAIRQLLEQEFEPGACRT
ncbi:thioesterase family protein [Candidatus Sororendozoicomonas aggregata]|uniref:acyl-CoA thioesterase n=1 Tax=Candidatus Sororendozoicomonas aggregata TaxID=3073239 RepID=UPI002ED4FDEE